jgi:hypothetical protein
MTENEKFVVRSEKIINNIGGTMRDIHIYLSEVKKLEFAARDIDVDLGA